MDNKLIEQKEMKKEWDVFISHAWEDKDTIVRDLANALETFKVKIWYDEFTLEMGDSLVESINRGLIKSKFGIVVLSKSFFKKHWAKYELRSLLTKEENGQKVILPIWHNVNKNDIKEYSLDLADRLALSTSDFPTNRLALELTKVIRPDIYKSIYAEVLFRKILKEGETEWVEFDKLIKQEKPQSKLSKSLEVRARIIHHGIGQLFNTTIDESIYNYELDLRPDREIQTWELMNLCYLEYIKEHEITCMETKKEIAAILLGFTLGMMIETKLSEEVYMELHELWKQYYYEF